MQNKIQLLALAIVTGIFTLTVQRTYKEYSTDSVRIIRAALPKTVGIHVTMSGTMKQGKKLVPFRGTFTGSGVFITPQGHVLTCSHLFNHEGSKIESISVMLDNGDTYAAELLNIDISKDLGLLKITPIDPKDVPYAALADPRSLEIGQEVIAIGSPLGLSQSVSHGIISALTRDLSKAYNLIQIDAAINPGNSGGPLFNVKGELVGINIMIVSNTPFPAFQGIAFSVNPGQVIEFLTKYKGLDYVLNKVQ